MGKVPILGSRYKLGSVSFSLTNVQTTTRNAILQQDSPSDYEATPCLCGYESAEIILSEIDRHGLPCRNVLCRRCGLIRISPRWKDERYSSFYATQYRDLYNRIDLSKWDFAKQVAESDATRRFGEWIKSVRAIFGGTQDRIRIVEIGTGGGWNLAGLPDSWERIGYDVDEEYLDIGRKAFGIDMRRGFMKEALDALAEADLVLLSHVVEHFPDPVKALADIKATMNPAGLLLIEVPGIFRLHHTHFNPMPYMQNAHTFTFCAATLADVCKKAGWQVLACDETCRAVCSPGPTGLRPGPDAPDPERARRILSYLRKCEQGWLPFLWVRRIPLVRGVVIRMLKRFYFPGLRRFIVSSDSIKVEPGN